MTRMDSIVWIHLHRGHHRDRLLDHVRDHGVRLSSACRDRDHDHVRQRHREPWDHHQWAMYQVELHRVKCSNEYYYHELTMHPIAGVRDPRQKCVLKFCLFKFYELVNLKINRK